MMGGQEEISVPTGDLPTGIVARCNYDRVADNRAKAIDLGTELYLDRLSYLQCYRRLGLIRDKRRVWGDKGRRRDGRGVGDSWSGCQSYG